MEMYLSEGIPEGSTMHGAFYDVAVFSNDSKIRDISMERMKQSMAIAEKLGVKGVVFHTNYNPKLRGEQYDNNVIIRTVECLGQLLEAYPHIDIYLENMFDETPDILAEISEHLKEHDNYDVCLDYAHASISQTPVNVWVEKLAAYVRHIHINDNDLKQDLHLPLGNGQIDWNLFVELYKRCFDDCSVLIETTLPGNQRISLEYLQNNFMGLEELICQKTRY
jgi:sugar phosphate isomerase/epimerase